MMLDLASYSPGFIGLLFGLGACVGLLGGFFGFGGGWIITPCLNIFGMGMSMAVGTGFGYIMGMSMISTYKHRRHGNLELRLGLVIGLTMMVGVHLGKMLIIALDKGGQTEPIVRVLYIVLLLGLGIYMLKDALTVHEEDSKSGAKAPLQKFCRKPLVYLPKSDLSISLWPLLGIGLVTGFLAGLLGVGGGFMLVPSMVYLIGVPSR
jgi:uncharacterized membrane protein YfcA